jgi:hypothetical protein
MSNEQHREDTKYVQWQDGMYVMIYDLAGPLDEQEYALALVEDSLRGSVYFRGVKYFNASESLENKMGITCGFAGYWFSDFGVKLTRAQAIYIATGYTDI